MNARQEKLLEELPKNNNIVKRAGIKAGYSKSYANSQLPQVIRRCKEYREYFNEETVKKELKKALKDCKSKEDRTNLLRAIELMSKILGMQLDRTENKTTITDERKVELTQLANRLNVTMLTPTG